MDLLGYGSNAPNVVTNRPADSRVFGNNDTYGKDCSSPGAGDGTSITAAFMNGLLGQLRALIRGNGQTLALADVLTIDNADDTMALRAIQYLIQRGQMSFGEDSGAPNAVVVALTPELKEYRNGARISVWITNDNDGGPATINVNGVGLWPITRNDGSQLQRRDLRAGCLANFTIAHNSFRLEMPVAFSSAAAIVRSSALLNISLTQRSIALLRSVAPAAQAITLPAGAPNAFEVIIEDVFGNLQPFPATVTPLGVGETIANAANYVMNRNFQSTTFRLYDDGASRIWSRST